MSVVSASAPPPASSNTGPVLDDFASLWMEARDRYEKETGHSLQGSPWATGVPSSPDEVMGYFEKQKQLFNASRASGEKIRGVLRKIVDVVLFVLEKGEGLAGIIPGGDAIFAALGVLLKATKGVSELFDAVADLLEEIQLCLGRMRSHLSHLSTSLPSTLKHILVESLVQVLISIAIATKYCKRVTSKVWYKRAIKIIFWRTKVYFLVLVDQADVKVVLGRLRELAVQETQTAVADIGADMREVKQIVVSKDLLTWLDSPNPQVIQDNMLGKRHAGTCQWFFDAEFEDWKALKGGIYWVYGNAGIGKSIFCSSVINKQSIVKDLALAYFYFDYNHFRDVMGKDFEPIREMVSSLVLQLAKSSTKCFECLEKEHSSAPRLTAKATTSELTAALMKLLGVSGPTIFILDGLDELPQDLRKLHLFPFFEKLRRPDVNAVDVRMLVTSRPEPDIREYYSLDASDLATRHIRHLNLHLAGSHKDDLRVYIDDQLSGSAFSQWPADLRSEARELLLRKSEGMFMWLQLQFPVLEASTAQSGEMIEQILNELPDGLDATYERILMNFPTNSVLLKGVLRVFECVAFAIRPLTPAEVHGLLYCNFDSSGYVEQADGSSCPQAVSNSEIEADILRKCPGLLEISGFGRKRIVRFTHFSVREFLSSSRSTAAPYHLEERSSQITLAKICLSIIETPDCCPELRKYADYNWRNHISSLTEEALCEPLCRLLESSAFIRWGSTASKRTSMDGAASDDTALHWAARLGLCRHVTKLIQGDTPSRTIYHVRAVNEFGLTPLDVATRLGQIDACRILLGEGALVNAHDEDYRDGPIASPSLHYAASLGRAEICDLLIQNGASLDGVDKLGLNPLHHAAKSMYYLHTEAVLAALLDNLSAENSAAFCGVRDYRGRIPLHHAALNWEAGTCWILLRYNGATIDEIDQEGHTPLNLCILNRSIDIFNQQLSASRLLLKHRQAFYAPHAGPKLDREMVSEICQRAKAETKSWLSGKPRRAVFHGSFSGRNWFLLFKDFSEQFEQSASEVPEVQELLLAITKPDPNKDFYPA